MKNSAGKQQVAGRETKETSKLVSPVTRPNTSCRHTGTSGWETASTRQAASRELSTAGSAQYSCQRPPADTRGKGHALLSPTKPMELRGRQIDDAALGENRPAELTQHPTLSPENTTDQAGGDGRTGSECSAQHGRRCPKDGCKKACPTGDLTGTNLQIHHHGTNLNWSG